MTIYQFSVFRCYVYVCMYVCMSTHFFSQVVVNIIIVFVLILCVHVFSDHLFKVIFVTVIPCILLPFVVNFCILCPGTFFACSVQTFIIIMALTFSQDTIK